MTYTLMIVIPAIALVATIVLWRLRPGTLPLLIGAALVSSAYVAANVMIATDYKDADGFVDCWPYCSGVQEAVKVAFWFGGGLLVLIGVVSLVWAALAVARRGRDRTRPA